MPSITFIFSHIVDRLICRESIVLATIVDRNGSAPRTSGAQMVIHRDGSIAGTIGGGLLEADCIRLARDIFQDQTARLKVFHLTGKDAASSDMICGGNEEVLLEYLEAANPALISIFQTALHCQESRKRGWWVIQLPDQRQPVTQLSRWFIGEDGMIQSNQPIYPNEVIPFVLSTRVSGKKAVYAQMKTDKQINLDLELPRVPMIVTAGYHRFYIEPLTTGGTVYIFGAGHVSQKLALFTSQVGFRTVVLDDRAEFANSQRFPDADEIIVLKDNVTALQNLHLDPDAYLVIVTRGHLHDKVILQQALDTPAVYIGMIGSQRKREEIYRALKAESVSAERLAQVYSPIGLPIDAETPEEIAVSITAEMIKVRASQIHANAAG